MAALVPNMAPGSQEYVIQHLQKIIWYSLDNNLLSNALFTVERLMAIDSTNNTRHLYGLVLLRVGRYKSAFNATANIEHEGCVYVFAQAALELKLENEGIEALRRFTLLSAFDTNQNQKDNERHVLPDPAACQCLLGKLYRAIGDIKEASICHTTALKLNPYLWESFEELCNMGVNVRVKSLFKNTSALMADSLFSIPNSSSQNAKASPHNSASTTITRNLRSSSRLNHTVTDATPTVPFRSSSSLISRSVGADSTPLIGKKSGDQFNPDSFKTPKFNKPIYPDAPARRAARATTFHNDSFKSSQVPESGAKRASRFLASKVQPRLSSTSNQSSNGTTGKDSLIQRKGKLRKANNTESTSREHGIQYITNLYSLICRGYRAMCRYDCYTALRIFNELPESHRETTWVLGKIGRLQFETVNYSDAEETFRKLHAMDRTRLEDMEYYSTLLWHLHKDIQLSYLAHELADVDKKAPQTWCALGNSYSLQRDTDQALRCFKRAIQLDPNFAYAHTLQGHEYVATDAFENSLDSFRSALLVDKRHYNALYGIGMVHLKLGDVSKAEYFFRRACEINPINVVLICCVGMVLERLGKREEALQEYEQACKLQPNSALSRFKRGHLLVSMQQYTRALTEFEELQQLAPDEASVHFLLGQLYKYFKNKDASVKQFTIALELDPKGSHLIKEAMEGMSEL